MLMYLPSSTTTKQGMGEVWVGREVEELPRDKECNLFICMILAAVFHGKSLNFETSSRNALRGKKVPSGLPRFRFDFLTYQSASDCGRSVSHLVHRAM